MTPIIARDNVAERSLDHNQLSTPTSWRSGQGRHTRDVIVTWTWRQLSTHAVSDDVIKKLYSSNINTATDQSSERARARLSMKGPNACSWERERETRGWHTRRHRAVRAALTSQQPADQGSVLSGWLVRLLLLLLADEP